MADSFSRAQDTIANQQKALLAATAQGGTAAAKALADAQAQVAAQRQQAISEALAGATARNAPGSMQAAVQGTVGLPYTQAQTGLTESAQSHQQLLNSIAASGKSYTDKAIAAAPLARAAAERVAVTRSADNALKQREMDIRNRELDIKESELANGKPLTGKDLATRLIGAGRWAKEDAGTRAASAVDPSTFWGARAQARGRGMLNDLKQTANTPAEALARQLGVGAGMDPARVYGLVPDAKEAKAPAGSVAALGKRVGLSQESVHKARQSIAYRTARDLVEAQRNPTPPKNMTPEETAAFLMNPPKPPTAGELRALLRSSAAYKTHPKTLEVLIADALGG